MYAVYLQSDPYYQTLQISILYKKIHKYVAVSLNVSLFWLPIL